MRWLLIAAPFALLGCASPPAPPPTVVLLPAPADVQRSNFEVKLPDPPPPPAQDPAHSLTHTLLATADRMRALPPSELAQEIARLASTPATPFNQMQFALALVHTRIPADSQRAVQVLQRLLAQESPEARALHPLARLLSAQLAEQRRVEDNAERQAVLLRDAQRRIEQLNDRLEALRAIERARPSRAAH